MVQGRAQWLDAVTVDGKSVFLVNLHQATSSDAGVQRWTWDCIQQMVLERNNERGIMAGDFNAGVARALEWQQVLAPPVRGIELNSEEVKSALGKQWSFSRCEWDKLHQPSISAKHYVWVENQCLQAKTVERARFDYAESARHRNQASDAKLERFVYDTGGRLVSPMAPSRAGKRDLTEAKLDHLIVWNMEVQGLEGIPEWIGREGQDHARVQFEVGREVLGSQRPKVSRPRAPQRSFRIQDAKAIKPMVDARRQQPVTNLLHEVQAGKCDAREAKDECLRERLRESLDVEDSARHRQCRQRMGSKLPHRNKQQMALRRGIMTVAASVRDRSGQFDAERHKISVANSECLRIAGLEHLEQKLTASQLLELTRQERWAEGIDGMMDILCRQQQSIAKQQNEQQRKSMDAECRRRMREDPGAWGEFTGKKTVKPTQTELIVPIVRGFMGKLCVNSVTDQHWRTWRDSLQQRVPGVVVRTCAPGSCILWARWCGTGRRNWIGWYERRNGVPVRCYGRGSV